LGTASPLIFVKKKDNKHKLCTDYRALNKVIKRVNTHYHSVAKHWTDWEEPSTSPSWISRTPTTTVGSGKETNGRQPFQQN